MWSLELFFSGLEMALLLIDVLQCEMVPSCGHPGVPSHGRLDLDSSGKAVYRCDPGFFLLGERVSVCDSSTNKWTEQFPSCVGDAAVGRPVFTSTESENRTAQMATDQFSDFGGIQNDFTCAETDEEHLPWLIVDFLEIHKIVGYNITKLGTAAGTDNLTEAAQNHSLEILIGNSTADFRSNKFCGKFDGLGSEDTVILEGHCAEPILGRYGLLRATRKPVFLPMKLGVCKIQFFSSTFVAAAQCASSGQRVYQNRCYGLYPNEEISEIGLTWDLANSYCKQTGGQLLGNISENLRNFIAWELAQLSLSMDRGPDSYWIGLYRQSAEAAWNSLEGEMVSEGFWRDSPDSQETRDNSTYPLCALIISEEPKYWTTNACSAEAGWICQYNVTSCGPPTFPPGISSYTPVEAYYNAESLVSYKCREDGPSHSRLCLDSGLWSGNLPSCDGYNCPELKPPLNGRIKIPGNGSVDRSFDCDAGHLLEGSGRLECMENGSWSRKPPRCTRIMCEYPPLIEHGDFLLSPNESFVGTRLLYSCMSGYTLEGFSILTCLSDGTWSNSWPSCRGVRVFDGVNPNVELSSACGCALSAQPHALDSSTFGFHSIENSDTSCFTNCSSNLCVIPKSVLKCLDSGQWNASLPSCELGSVMLNPPDLYDEVDPDMKNKKRGNRLSETNWAMLIAGIVGIALFIAIVGFGTALILSRRKKRRQTVRVPREVYTATLGQPTYVERDNEELMEQADNPVSLIYQSVPTLTVEAHREQQEHYGSLPGRRTQHYGQLLTTSPQPAVFTSPQFLALGSVDGKAVIYSSLPIKKQQENMHQLRGSTRVELERQEELRERGRSSRDSLRGESRERNKKSPSRKEWASETSRQPQKSSELVRSSSSSSNPDLSPVQRRPPVFGRMEARSRKAVEPTEARRVSMESSTSESNLEVRPVLTYDRSSHGSGRGERAWGEAREGSGRRDKLRPMSVASSAGVDNEAFSLEEIVIPDTLAVQSGYESERRPESQLRRMSPIGYEDNSDDVAVSSPRVRELQTEILASPLFQKLKKVHGNSVCQRQKSSESQESRLPEDPRHSHREERNPVYDPRKWREQRDSPADDRKSSNLRWRTQPRQMPPSPPPPPPLPIHNQAFAIPRLDNRRASHQVVDNQNVYQSLDHSSLRPPESPESSKSPEPRLQAAPNPVVPKNVSISYVIDPKSKALTEIKRTTEYFDPSVEEEASENVDGHPDRDNSTLYPPPARGYPPAARFYPSDSWQNQPGRRTPTGGLRRVSLPKEEESYDDGVRAVYFNDAAPITSKIQPDSKRRGYKHNVRTTNGAVADVSASEGEEEHVEMERRRGKGSNLGQGHRGGGRRGSDDRSITTDGEKSWRNGRAEEGNVLLDDRALQDLLESVNFELDRNFVEPVELRTYASNKRHPTGSRDGPVRHQTDRAGKRVPKAAPRSSLLRVGGNEESDSSPRLPSNHLGRSKMRTSNTPVPSTAESTSSYTPQQSTMWDAKKFKHRHKKVQFSDAVDEYMLSIADRNEGATGSARPQVISETYSNPTDRNQ